MFGRPKCKGGHIVEWGFFFMRYSSFSTNSLPDKEIKIKYTGLRPGEKLYEEVLSNEENTLPTTHQKIKVAKVREYKYANIVPELEHLALAARQIQILETVRLMKQIIPEFKSKNSCFEELDKQKESALSQSNL